MDVPSMSMSRRDDSNRLPGACVSGYPSMHKHDALGTSASLNIAFGECRVATMATAAVPGL